MGELVGRVVWTLSQAIGPLFGALVLGVVLLVVLRWAPKRTSRLGRPAPEERRHDGRRRRGGRPDAKREKALRDEEFLDAVGQPRERYMRSAYLITTIIALATLFLAGSVALTLIFSVFYWSWWTGRAKGRINQLRAGLLGEEVLPAARAVAGSLSTGMSLAQGLADLLRSPGETPLKRSIRRALADARGLEEGLHEEEVRARQDLTKEFFEILADGASAARNSIVTAQTLDKYADINERRRNAYRMALRVTVQARGTRTMLMAIVPFMYGMGLMVSGPDVMLRTVGGNVVTLAIAFFLSLATLITNKIISGVTKGF